MVSISEEVEFLKLYIDLEKRRLDKQLDYTIELSDELKDYDVISLGNVSVGFKTL